MMILRHIALYLNVDEYPKEYRSDFGFRTRHVCNFLERRLRAEKFHADGFSKICIQGKHAPDEACPIVSENAAVPSVLFDQERYESLGPGEYHEFLSEMLCIGLEKCARHHRIPLSVLMDSLAEFRRKGFKNEWTHQSKLLRAAGLRASLLCSLDIDRFVLTLELERKGVSVFKEQVLETKPDELIFQHRFKEVVLDGDNIVVKNKFGKPTFSLPVSLIE